MLDHLKSLMAELLELRELGISLQQLTLIGQKMLMKLDSSNQMKNYQGRINSIKNLK